MIGRIQQALWVVIAANLAAAVALAQPPAPRVIPDEFIVAWKPGATSVDHATVRAKLSAEQIHEFGFIGAEHLRLPPGKSVNEVIRAFLSDPSVQYIEPNYEVSIDRVSNDPRFPEMYGLRNTGQNAGTAGADISATRAWELFTGDSALLVGVIDTGIDYGHPDLIGNVWTNLGEIPGNATDDDHNGYVDDVHGYDFVNNDGDPFDDNHHGTHCSGTIAASGNNGVGVVGVSWRARIAGIKFLNATGSGSIANAIRAVQYAMAIGVRLTNNSWSGGGYSQALLDAINAAGAAGQLFVAAAGNEGSNSELIPSYPSGYNSPYIISVAATDRNDLRSSFSNYGATTVDLAAPGALILSTMPGGAYGLLSGTSMAAPHVSGVTALVMGYLPNASSLEVKQRILDAVDVMTSLAGRCLTSGRLNAFRALTGDYAVTTTGSAIVVTDMAGHGDVLTVSESSAGAIRFDAPGRLFSVNGGPFIIGGSGDLSLAAITAVTLDAATGADTIDVGGFTAALPSLALESGADDDVVNFLGDIRFDSGASLDVNLENDDLTPGADAVNLAPGANLTVSGAGSIAVQCGGRVSLAAGASLGTAGGAITLIGNSMSLGAAAAIDASGGSVTLRPYGAGVAIDLGATGDPASGPLGLSDAELDVISADTIGIGDVNSGAITVSAAIAHSSRSDFALASGADIVLGPGSLGTGGGALRLAPGAAGSVRPVTVNAEVATSATEILSFAAGANLAIPIQGTTPETDYGRLGVEGLVDLTGVDLILSGGLTPADGNAFVIVDNDGADAVTGAFNGLAEGATTAFNGASLRISYVGGDGNDVTLEAPTVAVPVTITIATSPAGLAMIVDGVSYTGSRSFQWAPGSAHPVSVASPQSLAAGTRHVFQSWSDAGSESHSVTTPSSPTTLTASFTTQHLLTTSAGAGGTVAPPSGFFDEGRVQITATPSTGYTLGGFGGALAGTVNPQSLDLAGPSTVTASFAAPLVTSIIDRRVAAGSDDAEESPSGSVSLGSSDLELVLDGSLQTVGLRFSSLAIPRGANITKAWVQFQADEAQSEATLLTIRGHDADHAPAFTNATRNLSSRARTDASVAWSPASWSVVGQAGTAQQSPDLKAVFQEIVDRDGWVSGNALALLLTGTGHRTAEAFEGLAAAAALLHVEFTTSADLNRAPVVDAGPNQAIPWPVNTVQLDGTVSDDARPALPGVVTTLWERASGPGAVSFDAVAAVDTRATFGQAGVYWLRLTASDGALSGRDSVRIDVLATAALTLERRVSAGSDDAEESGSGSVSLTSGDLELVTDGGVQTVGLRFRNVTLPRGAIVTSAWVQFQADEAQSAATNLVIKGEASDNAAVFTTSSRGISRRSRTVDSTTWTPEAWVVGEVGARQRTPDLSAVFQRIVGRSGWASGNALALIVTGEGHRTAESFEGLPSRAPLLHIEYRTSVALALGDGERFESPGEIAAHRPTTARVVPHPLRHRGVIELSLGRAGAVSVELYDLQGRRLRTLLDERVLAAGPHRIDFGERLAPGLYFYRVRAPDRGFGGRLMVLE